MANYFVEKCDGMVWKAIQAAIDGVYAAAENPNKRVLMGTYGYSENGICFGCLATWGIEKIAGVDFTPDILPEQEDCYTGYAFDQRRAENQSSLIGCSFDDLWEFEGRIDDLRHCYLNDLFALFGKEIVEPIVPLEAIATVYWKEAIKPLQEYANQLKELGV